MDDLAGVESELALVPRAGDGARGGIDGAILQGAARVAAPAADGVDPVAATVEQHGGAVDLDAAGAAVGQVLEREHGCPLGGRVLGEGVVDADAA